MSELPGEVTDELFRIFVTNVVVAIACGGMIGLERQLRGKPAGLRVCIIVVLTTAFFITIGVHVTPEGSDATRIVSAIITGVGFLGAGVIFSQGGRIQGITTASLIWALAAVGVTIGYGYQGVAFVATLILMSVIALIDWLEWLFPRLRKEFDPKKDEWRSGK